MSVKIRLSRCGRKKRPFFRLVAIDTRKKRDGAYLENLGTYDPFSHELIQFHKERIDHWLSVGALFTDSAAKLYKMHSKQKPAAK
ncbi:30S ribosomal protein S16 [bacterium]|jgi:small subunit ribosomal protein S16|nr:30S ribosomal protein S16 [bacterium]